MVAKKKVAEPAPEDGNTPEAETKPRTSDQYTSDFIGKLAAWRGLTYDTIKNLIDRGMITKKVMDEAQRKFGK